MGNKFNGNALQLPFDGHSCVLAAKLGIDISIGDLLCFDDSTSTVIPMDYVVVGVNDTLANIEENFVGVAVQANTNWNPTAGFPAFPQKGFFGITCHTEIVYLADVDLNTFKFGELVQPVVGNPTKVAKCSNNDVAIGFVIGDYTTAATNKIRVRLISGRYSPYTNQNLQGPMNSSIASGSITATQIASGQVVKGLTAGINVTISGNASDNYTINSVIGSGNVSSGMLANNSVVSGSIGSGQIGASHIASGVIPPSFSLTSGIVQSGNLGNNSVVSGSIASGSIGKFHVSSGAVVKGLTQGTNVTITADANDVYTINSTGGGASAVDLSNQFRLSVTSGVAIDANVTSGAATIFMVPYTGNKIALFSGNVWGNVYASGSVSIATSALSSGQVYDIFAYNNAGTPALEYSAAYTTGVASGGISGANTRTDALNYVNGIPLKNSDTTRRLVATVLGFTSGQTSMTDHTKGLANADNQIPMNMTNFYGVSHTFANLTTSGHTNYQSVNNAPSNQVRFVSCFNGIACDIAGQPSNMTKATGAIGTLSCVSYFGNNITLTSGQTTAPAGQNAVWLPAATTNTNATNDPAANKSTGKVNFNTLQGYNVAYPIEYNTASGSMGLGSVITHATTNCL